MFALTDSPVQVFEHNRVAKLHIDILEVKENFRRGLGDGVARKFALRFEQNYLVILEFGLRKLRLRDFCWQFARILRKGLVSIDERRNFGKQFIFAGEAHGHLQAVTLRKLNHARSQMPAVFRVKSAKQVVKVDPLRIFHPHARQQDAAQFPVRKA